MSNKIKNPVVLIRKRENSDTYAVAITSGSKDYLDAVLMATMDLDMAGDDIDTWSKTGYYMAAEIENLRQQLIAPLSIGELLQRLESQTGKKWECAVNDVTTGKPLTITLPDTSSKAFWSGTGKSETFHPETYKRQVKEAIERSCVIAGIGVEVK
ncbi:TPA: ATPase [Salmonella enterica]|uniref:ATPase n=2 Tax=Salmonella enterica TaxID=28901 RepID=A0A750EDS1_SALER|nr:ATPase [Salmonella enterica subsp. enterica serovar Kottbus]EAC0379136.1 ATPase [Salmonella enterica subsp. enterica serovar Potsdam]EBF9678038.1 ATPase [Salmonella enterica subsp. enterica serovar Glostrup]EBR7327203.1 ATPase [Salmonella enterica]EBS5858958.1 ATPase [Salmonella enterica subsp. enterica serovar Richmond]EBU9250004.1 ATPase [Salmonella enterica subsp. enterica serovar Oslo]EBX6495999.1 ATPase [Salmonella enterica subsp. enterica serovar Abony]EBZ4061318.1 ATPase [Salmonell